MFRAGYGIGFVDPIGAAGILSYSNEFNISGSTTSTTLPSFPFKRAHVYAQQFITWLGHAPCTRHPRPETNAISFRRIAIHIPKHGA